MPSGGYSTIAGILGLATGTVLVARPATLYSVTVAAGSAAGSASVEFFDGTSTASGTMGLRVHVGTSGERVTQLHFTGVQLQRGLFPVVSGTADVAAEIR